MRRIFLIDCPGVVYPTGETETETILKGVVRVEYVKYAEYHIPAVLQRVKQDYIAKTYKIASWTDSEDFLKQFATRSGRLLKGGEPDISTAAKMVLNDWQRGKLPYYVRPPESEGMEHKVKDDTTEVHVDIKQNTDAKLQAAIEKVEEGKKFKVEQNFINSC